MTNTNSLPTWDEIFANLESFISNDEIDAALARINAALELNN